MQGALEAVVKQQAKRDSTENLLDVIRGRKKPLSTDGTSLPGRKGKSRNRSCAHSRAKGVRGFTFGRDFTVGLDISVECIRLAAFRGKSGKGRFRELARRDLGPATKPGTDGFGPELQDFLAQHIAQPKKTRIWALLRTAEVDVTTLRLPKMPARRLSSAVYWQLQKEKKFDPQDFVLDYRVQGTSEDAGMAKHDIVACLAKRADIDGLSGWIESAGYQVAGITLVPAAFQSLYRLRWCGDTDDVVANIHVDVDFTCISIFSSGRLLFSRTIKFGISSLAEDLLEQYNSKSGDGDLEMFVDENETTGIMDASDAAAVIGAFVEGTQALQQVTGSELSHDQILDLVSHSLDRVSRQAERTLDYFAQNFNARCTVLHLSGHVFGNAGVSDYLASQLGMNAEKFNPLQASGRKVQEGRYREPDTFLQFNEAIALAVSSDSATLNLKHTYVERDQIAAKSMISNIIALAALVLVLVGAGLYVWGNRVIKDRTTTLAAIESKLDGGIKIDESVLQLAAGKVAIRAAQVRQVGERYRTLALLTEVSSLVPEGVRLLTLQFDYGQDPSLAPPDDTKANKAKAAEEEGMRKIVLNGIVMGGYRDQETLLTRLLANLESSLLLRDVAVETQDIKVFVPEGPVMHFVVEAELS